ncbi:MAG: hypothetical protein KF724_01360 [Phycisphaeraceae bacterium]|nr:hypothetical protein [Phycisphaeraceae bacterium]
MTRTRFALRTRTLLTAGAFLLMAVVVSPFALGTPGGRGDRGGTAGGQVQLPTTPDDFFLPGTQPNPNASEFARVQGAISCSFCHSDYSIEFAPLDTWVASVMGQSARDPVWHAALAIANQDAAGAGTFCIRCHAPGAWLGGRGADGTTNDFIPDDFDGVNCHFCHRVVNPVLGPDSAIGYPENNDPEPDLVIIESLAKQGLLPVGVGNAQYVVDPRDVRRGPFDDVPLNFHGISELGEPVDLITSPFHQKSEFCGTCHDVSNPVFVLQPNGTFAISRMNEAHPSLDGHDMFPEQRTYSEWLNSDFATKGVVFPDGRFGGNNKGPIGSCQDCHMPDQVGGGCTFYEFPPFFTRKDMPQHSMAGANHWVVAAIAYQLGEDAKFAGLTKERVEAGRARTIQMLRDASDLELDQVGGQLRARVINQTGHKLPTGYPEGRRMWLNVKFYGPDRTLIAERGAYDFVEAELIDRDTKIYETLHGFDESVAKVVGLPAGKNFHLALANTRFFDNRIPPRGFTNEAYASIGAAPVGYTYADGQFWDDTLFAIPPGASQAVVSLLHEVSTREYMEFLRSQNVTNDAGEVAYTLWEKFGKGILITMDHASLDLGPGCIPADLNCDGVVNGADIAIVLGSWGPCPGCAADLNGDGVVNGADIAILLGNWG